MAPRTTRDPDSITTGQITVRLDLDVRKMLIQQANSFGVDEATLARMKLTEAVTNGVLRDELIVSAMNEQFSKLAELVCAGMAASLPTAMNPGETPDEFKARLLKVVGGWVSTGQVLKMRIDSNAGKVG